MASKRLYGHYLRSYEQFQKNSDFKGDFQAKSEKKIVYTIVFLSTQKLKQNDQKMEYQPLKVQEKKNSKNGVKTTQRPIFKEL